MIRQTIFIAALAVWLVTLLMLLPCTGVSCAFVVGLMNLPRLPFRMPGGDLIVILSYPISLVLMVIASVLVVLAARNDPRVFRLILAVDLVTLAVLLPLWYSAASFLPK